jgi:triphosphoribosyl-dephospho-CoA synthase
MRKRALRSAIAVAAPVPAAHRPPEPARRALAPEVIERIADAAFSSLLAELLTWPKPGLVSHVDSGSHSDMDCRTFHASAVALKPYFGQLAAAGANFAEMGELRAIGIEAEQAMLAATGGINTHRGAIFGIGLLCASAAALRASGPARRPLAPRAVCDFVAHRWGPSIARGPIPLHSHGSRALRRFGAGGARAEAANGFPHVVEIGLPALQGARAFAGDEEAARVQAFFALLATVEDTNLLHRGNFDGMNHAQAAARGFLAAGGVARSNWEAQALEIHQDFVRRRLSPGGCADLLAATVFLDLMGREP